MPKLPIPEPQVPAEPARKRAPRSAAPSPLPRWIAWAPSVSAMDKAARVRSGLSPKLLQQLEQAELPVPVLRAQSEAELGPTSLEVEEHGASPLYEVAVAATPGLVLPATGALLAILTPMVGPLALLGAVALTLVGMAWAAKRTFALLSLRSARRQALRLALTQQPLGEALQRLQALQLRLDRGDLPAAAQADLQASVWELWEGIQAASSTAETADDQALIDRLSAVEDTLAQAAPKPDPATLERQAQAAARARRETP